MSNIVIKTEHLSKMYRLGLINNGTLWRDIQTWTALKMGKEDPHSKIGTDKYFGDADHFWALKDVNFEIGEGDRVGIIGKNGAGKSTLLKLLSRVTSPSEGTIKIKGKISSLLEVGTGFNGELTGRENIYLNGAILGMKTRQIDRKLDEIIDFSEIEHHIDTPVKRYSSGMYVRLAFAVAAHLDSEILIADEVLAVGDATFQKKALGKMKDLSTGQGRTVLFVSHNLVAVKALCNKGIMMEKGRILSTGDLSDTIEDYMNSGVTTGNIDWNTSNRPSNEYVTLNHVYIKPQEGNTLSIDSGIIFDISFFNKRVNINIDCTIEISTLDDIVIFHNGIIITSHNDSTESNYTVTGILPPYCLNAGKYAVKLIIGKDQRIPLFCQNEIVSFEVQDVLINRGSNYKQSPGLLYPLIEWKCVSDV